MDVYAYHVLIVVVVLQEGGAMPAAWHIADSTEGREIPSGIFSLFWKNMLFVLSFWTSFQKCIVSALYSDMYICATKHKICAWAWGIYTMIGALAFV